MKEKTRSVLNMGALGMILATALHFGATAEAASPAAAAPSGQALDVCGGPMDQGSVAATPDTETADAFFEEAEPTPQAEVRYCGVWAFTPCRRLGERFKCYKHYPDETGICRCVERGSEGPGEIPKPLDAWYLCG